MMCKAMYWRNSTGQVALEVCLCIARTEEKAEAGTIAAFELHVDQHLNRKGFRRNGPNAGKWVYHRM